MRPSATSPLHAGADAPHAFEWMMIGLIGIGSLALTFAAATINLDPAEQAVLAVATVVVFLIANRRAGRTTTLFLTMLSALVSLRYIVWRVTETLEFNTALQSFLGVGLALAEAYAVVALAMGYVQTLWPLGRQPALLPSDSDAWPTVDVYIPTYNEDLSIVRATVLAAHGDRLAPRQAAGLHSR